MTTYQGYQVLDQVTPDRGDGQPHEFLRPQFVLSNAPGRSRFNPRRVAASAGYEFTWVCTSRTAKRAFRAWVDSHLGALVPFWVPTYRRDLVIVTDGQPSDTDLQIQRSDYVRHQFPHGNGRRHLAIWESGTTPALFRGVLSATEEAGHENLVLDGALGVEVTTATLVSFLMLVRLADDVAQLEHHGPEYGEVTVSVVEVPAEVPTPA